MKISKKSMVEQYILRNFSYYEMREHLDEMREAADEYGYEMGGESQYYQYYEELLQEVSASASDLYDELRSLGSDELLDFKQENKVNEHLFDIYGVAMFGLNNKILFLDGELGDYFYDPLNDKYAHEQVQNWLEKRTKRQLITEMAKVAEIYFRYLEIKASFDCIASVITELDEKGAILARQIKEMEVRTQKLYDGEITEDDFDEVASQLPVKAWVY